MLYSFTVNHVAMSPTVSELTPYAVVLVETDDGPRVLAHASPALELRIGTRVRLVERPAADVSLYPGAGFRVAEPEGR
ncbi:MAG: OB-fold domain, acyl-CoA-associated [Microbacteriaceae bacterium]|nr:OB-fold domain, acyl-CoA-associated [Microbacteriaceae bacterium]